MIAARTTRLPRLLRLLAPLRARMLRAEIASAELYLRYATEGRVMTASEVDQLRANITPLRVELALWEIAVEQKQDAVLKGMLP